MGKSSPLSRWKSASVPTNSNNHSTITTLGYWTCYFIDIPDETPQDAIISPIEGDNNIYRCFFRTKYLSGDNWGPRVCDILCVLISIIGIFGVAANVVNILVLRHSTKGSSLQKLLVILACFDFLACFFAFLVALLLQLILDNVNRSKEIQIALRSSFLLYSLGRTGSVFITILVTVERYFVVVRNLPSKAWLHSRRPLFITIFWLFLILLINIPWWLNSVVVSQEKVQASIAKGPLAKYPAIFVATTFASRIYNPTWFRSIHVFIDYALPFPVLLLFNGLLYRFIYKWTKQRRQSTGGQSSSMREVNAAKMFSIVVITLFTCHTFAVIDYFVTESTSIVYRELHLTIMLAVTLNASSNFFVYYVFALDFKEYFWLLVGSKVCRFNTSPAENTAGRVSPEEDVILHEKVRYTKTHEQGEEGEQSRLLSEQK